MDTITFIKEKDALNFYLRALAAGIYARWSGVRATESGNLYYSVKVDVEKTMELIYKEG